MAKIMKLYALIAVFACFIANASENPFGDENKTSRNLGQLNEEIERALALVREGWDVVPERDIPTLGLLTRAELDAYFNSNDPSIGQQSIVLYGTPITLNELYAYLQNQTSERISPVAQFINNIAARVYSQEAIEIAKMRVTLILLDLLRNIEKYSKAGRENLEKSLKEDWI